MKKQIMLSGLVLLQACASIKTGNQKFLEIDSTPAGAEVWLKDEMICTTPCKYEITGARNEIFKVIVTKEGYGSYEQELKPKTHKEVEPDLIMCVLPPIGMTMLGIDYYTGSMWDYDKVNARLYKTNYKTAPKITSGMELSPAAERYINDNFARLKEEAFAVDGSKERIRTLASLTSISMERLTGMLSEAKDAPQLIEFITRFGR